MRWKWSWVTAALPSLVHALEPDDEAFVLEINEQPRIIQDLTSSQLGLSQAIDSLTIDGGTSFYEAVLHGLRRIANGRHRLKGLLVVADDGQDPSRPSIPTPPHHPQVHQTTFESATS